MLSKSQLGFLRSLHQKKFRQMYGKFLVEGDTLVRELLASDLKIEAIFGLKGWKAKLTGKNTSVIEISEEDLGKISTHTNPNQVIAVAEIPKTGTGDDYKPTILKDGLYVACDNISDPGNAGTIIRTADWFGIKELFFSEGSVDFYNPKVVNAAKGSLFRIKCVQTDLKKLFEASPHLKVYGTYMNGENIYSTQLNGTGIILLGNEANGIHPRFEPFIHKKLTIPLSGKVESLNAAVAAGIVMSEFRRRTESA